MIYSIRRKGQSMYDFLNEIYSFRLKFFIDKNPESKLILV